MAKNCSQKIKQEICGKDKNIEEISWEAIVIELVWFWHPHSQMAFLLLISLRKTSNQKRIYIRSHHYICQPTYLYLYPGSLSPLLSLLINSSCSYPILTPLFDSGSYLLCLYKDCFNDYLFSLFQHIFFLLHWIIYQYTIISLFFLVQKKEKRMYLFSILFYFQQNTSKKFL